AARFYREAFGVELRAELEVESLGEAHARAVAAGAEVVTTPHDGAATYRDPDGNLVTLTELAGAARVAGVDLARGGLAVVVLEENRIVGPLERRRLLEEAGIELPESAPRIAEPDRLDATIAAWSARRYVSGEAAPLPEGHASRIGAIWR